MRDETLVPGVELLESMRSVGYSVSAAAADIIDNSIAADAQEIDLFLDTVRGSYVGFLDDGVGMSPDEARNALKLAGTRSLEREEKDLGRFGLGLKTASLSQGRQLTVVTKRNGVTSGLRWDLDHVMMTGKWAILVLDQPDLQSLPHIDRLEAQQHGTLVLWQSLDYLLAGATDVSAWMGSLLITLREHIGLVFQRFLEGRNALQIRVNGVPVAPVDPFLERNSRTQASPIENVVIDGQSVSVEAFTLPHASHLTAAERRRDDLGHRMREHQGFYVYRNRRLISAGGWFGLAKQDELSKQTRVRVDVPPGLDHHWQLDIKKSRIEPPQAFRQRFRQIIDRVKVPSNRVHRFRGRSTKVSAPVEFLWRVIEDRDGFRYEINAQHPAIQAIFVALPDELKTSMEALLRDIANTFPVNDAYVRMADSASHVVPAYSDEEIKGRLRAIRAATVLEIDASAMSKSLSNVEPFNSIPRLQELVKQVWEEE